MEGGLCCLRGSFAILQTSEMQAVLLTLEGLQLGRMTSLSAITGAYNLGHC